MVGVGVGPMLQMHSCPKMNLLALTLSRNEQDCVGLGVDAWVVGRAVVGVCTGD